MALWGGRFEVGVAEVTQEFGASLPVDKHLYKQDIACSSSALMMPWAASILACALEPAISCL